MRHGNKINHLSRKTGHRRALLANMSNSLIEKKSIFTTLAKAKVLRSYLEPLLTRCKENTTHNRRVLFSHFQNKGVIDELFGTIAPKIMNRNGGYLRIIKTGYRLGDAAATALIEFVDFNELLLVEQEGGKKRRTRRGGKKTSDTTSTEPSNTQSEESNSEDNA